MSWCPVDQDLAIVTYPFSKDIPNALQLKLADLVLIKSKCKGWYYGHLLLKSTQRSTSGIFPADYVTIINRNYKSKENKQSNELTLDDIKTNMMTTILVQATTWITSLAKFQEEGDTVNLIEAEIFINKVLELFYDIANWSMDKVELFKLQNQFWMINKINILLKNDLCVRMDNYSMTNVLNTALVKLDRKHYDERTSMIEQKFSFNAIKDEIYPFSESMRLIVENFEYVGCTDEMILQWVIFDASQADNKFSLSEYLWQPIKEFKKGKPSWKGEKFIFKELADDLSKEGLYLVVFVYRIGPVLPDLGRPTAGKFRRPIAFGKYSVRELASAKEKIRINLHSPSEADFLRPTSELIKAKYPVPAHFRYVEVSVAVINTDISHEEFDIDHLSRRYKLQTDRPQKTDRNNLYIRLGSAEFDKGSKGSPRNVEFQCSLRDSTGKKIACMCKNPDIGNKYDYLSSITYHSNSPRWKELIEINLDESQADDCHILIDFYHCSTKDKKIDERKPFGTSFYKLSDFFELGVTSKQLTLTVLKLSDSLKQKPEKLMKSNSVVAIECEKTAQKEFCKIELFICSTKYSNNPSINKFLKTEITQSLFSPTLKAFLTNIQNISTEDFLKPKLRKEITNTLKMLISTDSWDKFDDIKCDFFLTWQTLANHYQKHKLTDIYETFLCGSWSFMSRIVSSIRQALQDAISGTASYDVSSISLSCTPSVFKILSRDYKNKSNIYDFDLTEYTVSILRLVLHFFQGNYVADPAVDIRKLLFNFIASNISHIFSILPVNNVIDFLDEVFKSPDFANEKILPKENLDFIHGLLKCGVHNKCLDILIIIFNQTVQNCIKHLEISSQYVSKATEILLLLFDEVKELTEEDRVSLYSQGIMKAFFTKTFNLFTRKHSDDLQQIKFKCDSRSSTEKVDSSLTKSEDVVSDETMKLHTLLFAYLEEWPRTADEDMPLSEYMLVIQNLKILLETKVYPLKWFGLYLKCSSIACSILQKTSMFFDAAKEEVYNKLTLSFFEACMSLIMQDHLQLQNFPYSKSQKITRTYGDMRITVSDFFLTVWHGKPNKFETFDRKFASDVTVIAMNISFLPVFGIRCKMVPMLVHAITTWVDDCGNIDEVQKALITKTEQLLRDGMCDGSFYVTLQQALLIGKIQPDIEEIIESLAILINLHLEYRNLKAGTFSSLHKKFLLHAFMKFFKERVEIFNFFQDYGTELSQLMESEEHYYEAAMILKHQYDWVKKCNFEQSQDRIFYEDYDGIDEVRLKEKLSKKILELLTQAKEYEEASVFCEELHSEYLDEYNYKELSSLLKQWAKYYELIMTEARLTLNYYRVTFIGGQLPSYMMTNRDYVVKGSMWFKTHNLQKLLQQSFPKATIKVYQSNPPTEKNEDANLTIYLSKVEPIPLQESILNNEHISHGIKNFYKDHMVQSFVSDHPFHKGTVDKDNEIKTLHICRLEIIVIDLLPNEFMWAPIVEEKRTILTPIEVAIDSVVKKNLVITDMMQEIQENPSKDMKAFAMLLAGTLDAGVNGGIPKLIEAFFSDSSDPDDYESAHFLLTFRNALQEQSSVLDEALKLHKKYAPPQMLPLHERLIECFNFLRNNIVDLDIIRKRSFSNIRNTGEIMAEYADSVFSKEASDAYLDCVSIMEKDYFAFRRSKVGASVFSTDSNCSSPGLMHRNLSIDSLVRSHSGSDNDLVKLGSGKLLSSTEEEEIMKLADDFYNEHKNNEKVLLDSAIKISIENDGSFDDFPDSSKLSPPALPPFPGITSRIKKAVSKKEAAPKLARVPKRLMSVDFLRKRPKPSDLFQNVHE